jgi:Protein of unknown function, DUF599
MTHSHLKAWLDSVLARPGGDILAIQTLRNAIMSASVLASAALVALMGVIAAAPHMMKWLNASLAVLLAISASVAVWSIVRFASFGFVLHNEAVVAESLAKHISRALQHVKTSASLLMVALCLAALGILA